MTKIIIIMMMFAYILTWGLQKVFSVLYGRGKKFLKHETHNKVLLYYIINMTLLTH